MATTREGQFLSLAEIVENYRRRWLQKARQELDRFRDHSDIRSLKEAIRIAAESRDEDGKRYDHQRKNRNFYLAIEALLKVEAEIERCSNFEELLNLVEEVVSEIQWVDEMYAYDVALRIGVWLRPARWPEKVYLHRGTRKGAEAVLGQRLNNVRALEMDAFRKFPEFKKLEPWQLEDILCIYKEGFGTQQQLG